MRDVRALQSYWRYGRAAECGVLMVFCCISGRFVFYELALCVLDELMSFRPLTLSVRGT